MKVAQDRQRSYSKLQKRPFEMNPCDLVMLKISSWYIRPFKILKKIGSQAFNLELPL